MKNLILIFVLILSVSLLSAQEKKSKKQLKTERKSQKIQLVKQLVDNKTFVFKAYSVIPKNEISKTLTSDFGIEVRNDSIFSYLPYYGNTYSRDYSSFKDSPMGFAQLMESYKRVKTKKGFEVNIKLKNLNEGIDLVFHISKMGDATVVASSLNRQAITYTGELFAPKSGE
ncbi:MAG TPA: DUF4251 domain-containing protein [Draconibacterium sp.]|nr:DUF4251 domain-containing protein [Draconibacterium sp.]HRX10160.1 DUF4251 domain-containing protein [Draconibacterium sp.]